MSVKLNKYMSAKNVSKNEKEKVKLIYSKEDVLISCVAGMFTLLREELKKKNDSIETEVSGKFPPELIIKIPNKQKPGVTCMFAYSLSLMIAEVLAVPPTVKEKLDTHNLEIDFRLLKNDKLFNKKCEDIMIKHFKILSSLVDAATSNDKQEIKRITLEALEKVKGSSALIDDRISGVKEEITTKENDVLERLDKFLKNN